MKNSRNNGDFAFEIIESIGVIANYQSGWTKELNMVSWNGHAAKFDIRDWDEEHMHMARGITLSKAEAIVLRDLLNDYLGAE